jgi:hypothetical protein
MNSPIHLPFPHALYLLFVVAFDSQIPSFAEPQIALSFCYTDVQDCLQLEYRPLFFFLKMRQDC